MAHDVIIVGAGPAGSTAARVLAESSKHVVIIDKAKFPRDKLCAGGVTSKVIPLLPPGFNDIIISSVHKTIIHYSNTDLRVGIESIEPCTYMVERAAFDMYLLDAAITSGVKFIEGKRVIGFWQDSKGVEVYTDPPDTFKANYLIAADGAMSRIHSQTFSQRQPYNAYCLEAKIPWSNQNDEVIFNFGSTPTGYAWIFPKGDYASIGLGVRSKNISNIFEYYKRFFDMHGIKWVKPKGLSLPMYSMETRLTHKRVLFAGDAAHLVDPITGEGIYHAILSGSMAAKAIISGGNTGTTYQTMMNKTILKELRRAFFLSLIMYHFPRLSFEALRLHPSIGKTYLGVITGENTYKDLLKTSTHSPYKILKHIIKCLQADQLSVR
ncbi:MAG: geranylgeranyl reductase family protein [Deltaproteobacteria bacterium]|nr:geranylgeranyl reductase family protein [Deltaproteobacteria bacterium]